MMLYIYGRLKWVDDCAHDFAVPHQGAYQYHAGSCDLAIRSYLPSDYSGGHCHIENGCLTLSDHFSYYLAFLGLHFPSAVPISVCTLGSEPFKSSWSKQRKKLAREN